MAGSSRSIKCERNTVMGHTSPPRVRWEIPAVRPATDSWEMMAVAASSWACGTAVQAGPVVVRELSSRLNE
eukprot:scaffold162605_cov18-Prasinocladus_malaysianus.AAC.1